MGRVVGQDVRGVHRRDGQERPFLERVERQAAESPLAGTVGRLRLPERRRERVFDARAAGRENGMTT